MATTKSSCTKCGEHIAHEASAVGESVNCPHCGEATLLGVHYASKPAKTPTTVDPDTDATFTGYFGNFLIVVGLIATIVAYFSSGASGGDSTTYNIGALNERQNGVIIGVGMILFGGLLLVVEQLQLLQINMPKRIRGILNTLSENERAK